VYSTFFHSEFYPSFRRKIPHLIFRKLPVHVFPHSANYPEPVEAGEAVRSSVLSLISSVPAKKIELSHYMSTAQLLKCDNLTRLSTQRATTVAGDKHLNARIYLVSTT